ncbi:hypothetical protein CAL29_10680 [Bordetella genomosp. 10]|uniref:ABC transporter ATP-binding protein n=1 Tax=Bordetella genomosp. 10 TaxID=1416804 RepID=A0A261SAL2_9BORD|nr:hypothetical protein CAL29_10680 [Bordetella genomosp. 10]
MLLPVTRAWLAGDAAAALRWTLVLAGSAAAHAALAYVARYRGYAVGAHFAAGAVDLLCARLPRVADWADVACLNPPGLVRGPVLRAMSIPAHLMAPMVSAVVAPLTVIAAMLCIDARIALYLLCAALLLARVLRWSTARTASFEEAARHAHDQLARQLQAYGARQDLLRTADQASLARTRLTDAIESVHIRTLTVLKASFWPATLFDLAVFGVLALFLALGTASIAHARIDSALCAGVLVVLAGMVQPLAALAHLGQALRGAMQAADAVLRALEAPVLASPEQGRQPRDGGLALVGVCHFTGTKKRLLDGVSLRIAPGQFVAMVGPSGAGKTALLGLCARLADPQSGAVLLGEIDACEIDEQTLARWRYLLPQDCRLVRGTVGWNLRMERHDLSDQALWRALHAVGMEAEVRSLPQGLDMEVGEGGGALSGGQRQRLCLARALLSPAPVWLLDEPTSQLDARNARTIEDMLTRHGYGRTRVATTHSPALAAKADFIVVLDQGRIQACAPHDVLVRENAWYTAFAETGDR